MTVQAQDRYGREVARVECAGQDASAEQVRRGMAWAFTRYQRDAVVLRLEAQARSERAGLWADAAFQAPWDWRRDARKAER